MLEDLEYQFTIKPLPDPELGHYVLEIEGKVVGWDDDEGREREVGHMRVHRVDLALARYDQIDMADLLDSITPDIAAFRDTAFHNGVCYLPGSRSDSSEPRLLCDCLVFVDEIEIDPALRSQGIGSEFFRRMSEMIDLENCIVGLKAYPLSRNYGEQRRPDDIQRVKQFYERLGFRHIGSDFMVKDGRECGAMRKRTAVRQAQPLRP